jgi:hypothetical protein
MRTELPRVLTVPIARQLGITRAAVRHGIARHSWRALGRGLVLTVPGDPTRADWALAGLAVAGTGSALSGWDALRLVGHRVAARTPPSDDVLILVRHGTNHRLGAARIRVTQRPFTRWCTSVHDPTLPLVPVASPARAFADTALQQHRLGAVRAMVAAAIQHGLCDLDELVNELAACPRNGSALLRRALAEIGEGARSTAEASAADYLRRAGVPIFERNAPIYDGSGQLVAVADVLWRELRAVLEIDSREFHFSAADWQATMRRHNALVRLGYAVMHYPPSALGPAWADEVKVWLRARAAELGIPYESLDSIKRKQPLSI